MRDGGGGEEGEESEGGRKTTTMEMNGGELRGGEGWRGGLIPHIRVPVTNKPEDMKAESKETCSNQVTQRCQVGDGEVVRIEVPAPHPVHHPVSNVQQNENLEKCSCHVENNENRGECSVSTLHGADGVKENQVSRHDQKEKHTGRTGIHI